MINNLILTTYPFVIFSSLATAIIMIYAVIKTSDTRTVLRWLLAGAALVALTLAFENIVFWWVRSFNSTYVLNAWSNSILVFTIKLSFGFGMWMHFCAALAAIRSNVSVTKLLIWGALIWALIYVIVLWYATT